MVPERPAEGGNGLAMRAGMLLEGLARSFTVRVVVAPVFGVPDAPTPLMERLADETRVLPLPGEPDPRADLITRLSTERGRARAAALHPLPALGRRVPAAWAATVAAQARGAALVFVMRLYLTPLLDDLLDGGPRPALIVDADDIESVAASRRGDAQEAAAFGRLERHYLPLVDRVLACSAEDARVLADLAPGAEVEVVPNGVRPPRGAGAAANARHDLLFVGNLSYAPNVRAATWFCREVLPRLPDARLALVGRSPAPEVRALERPGRVTVAGDVPDVTAWYAASRVALAPLPDGAGTSIKVIEALAHGLPVVATSLGARGLGGAVDRGLVTVTDDAGEMAAACRELLHDPARRARLGALGRTWVSAEASVDVSATLTDRLARDAVGTRGMLAR